ncbi:hypothetical protein ACGIF2_10610 [Cellulomonas sp. P22]|uniref:hypothetical protein n=1 Tax=Cellulomonas sp. P22 TaxID=3373189 RepID=UPI00379BB063
MRIRSEAAAMAMAGVLVLGGCTASGDAPTPTPTGARSLSPQDEAPLEAWEALWKACPMNTPPALIWGE